MSDGSTGPRDRSNWAAPTTSSGRACSSELRQGFLQRLLLTTISSFLGGGTELLISSVFEAGPGTTALPEGLGGKKASRVAVSPSASPQRPSKKLQSADTDSSDSSSTGNALDSPLAKAFGPKAGRQSALSKKQKKRKARRDDHGPEISQAGQEEVDALKKELGQVRESQLRMEELLSKVLAGSK